MPGTPHGRSAQNDFYALKARAAAGLDTLGLRDRHKMQKLERITEASLRLFSERGYDGTTLRDISQEAGIALGTLALYASDKRDLILLLFNMKIPVLMEDGARRIVPGNGLADNMFAYFEPAYRAYKANVRLYRILLSFLNLGSSTSLHKQELNRNHALLMAKISDMIFWARAAEEACPDGELMIEARSFFYLYFAAVRRWIAEPEPSLEEGLHELRHLFEMHVNGLKNLAGTLRVRPAPL